MKNMNDFGLILNSLRNGFKMSQKDLAEKAGIDPSHLNKIEKGLRMPSDDVIFRLADILAADILFTAAGRLIPPEFEEKHPLKELSPRLTKKEEIPQFLEKLFSLYETKFRNEVDNYYKKENDVRILEKMVSSWQDMYVSFKNDARCFIEENCPSVQEKLCVLLSCTDTLISLSDRLNRQQRELETITLEKGHTGGERFALPEVWQEIKRNIIVDPVKFLKECFEIEKEDAEFIVDLIQIRKKRQKPPTSE